MPIDLRKLGKSFGDISVESLSIEGWNKIDVVRGGLANDGTQDAGQFIQEHADNETLLVFPPGTYSFDTRAEIAGLENFGLISPTGRATFTEGTISGGSDFIEMGSFAEPVESCLIKGFTTDTTNARFAEIYGSGLVEDIRFTETKAFDSDSSTYHFSCRTFDEDKTLTFKDIHMPEGGAYGEPLNDAAGGFFVHTETAGTIKFIDCTIHGMPNNAIYASPPGETGGGNGAIHVEGGVFKNNNVASVRIGGDGSSVRDAKFIFDDPNIDFTGVRGVYARNGSGHTVENNRYETRTGTTDVAHARVTSDCGSVSFENEYHIDEGSARVLRVGSGTADKENRVTVNGLELQGSSDGEEYPIFIERDHTKISEPVVIQPNRSAFWITGNDVILENEDIQVGGSEVLNQGDRFVRNGVSENEGDPSSVGAWSGNVALANERGVLVYDTSTTPPTRYLAAPNDSFVTVAVDGDTQPPENHGNAAHTTNYTDTSPSDVNSSNWGDYEIQKNGTDGNGIINFKT